MAIPLKLSATTEKNLLALIETEVHEGKTIEYKREIALAASEQKRKFVRTVTSFANASGGELIFGVEAVNGKPVAIKSLQGFDPDSSVLRLRDLIRAHIDPPLFGVEFQPVPVTDGWTLVVRIPRSWNPPHMVTFDSDNRFYTRDASGCVPMNLPEIREAFFVGKTTKDRLQQYRFQRLNTIRAGGLPWKSPSEPVAVLHALPFRSFVDEQQFSLSNLTMEDWRPPTQWRTCNPPTYDIDGIYGYEPRQDGTSVNHIFVSFSGCIEGLTARSLSNGNAKFIGNSNFEKQFIDFVPRCIEIFRRLEIDPPVALALTLLDVNGYSLYSGPRSSLAVIGARAIQQRDLILPISVVSSFDVPVEQMIRPIFDALWRSCGLQHSFNYDKDGNFVERNWD
jgi:hypothetical protein